MPRHIPRSHALIMGSLLSPFTTSSAWDISEDRQEIPPKGLPVRRIGVVIKGVIALSMAMLWILLSAGTGYGQQSSAAVTGLVKDTSGAIISGTQVKIRNVETNTFRETVSNEAGNYTFLNVPPGRYTMEFSAQGFQKEVVAALELNVNQTLSLDVVLKVGRVDTTVTVEAENTAIQSSTAELGSVIAQKTGTRPAPEWPQFHPVQIVRGIPNFPYGP